MREREKKEREKEREGGKKSRGVFVRTPKRREFAL